MKTKLTGFLLAAALIWAGGCNQKQLKKPASTGDDKPAAVAAISEDHVRQMAVSYTHLTLPTIYSV